MIPAYKSIDNPKSAAPNTKLLAVWLKYGKKNPHRVGVSRILWARSDTIPVARRMIFLYESCDMLPKRIAQKGLFFYRRHYMTKSYLFGYLQF
jgi:hypothetical protein